MVVGLGPDVETNILKVTREALDELELCSRSCAVSSRVFMLEAKFVSNRGRRLTSPENVFISTLLLQLGEFPALFSV